MSMRQDETDVNFLDIKPADLEHAAQALKDELEAARRAWEKTCWTLEYVKRRHADDSALVEALETIRHHLERRF